MANVLERARREAEEREGRSFLDRVRSGARFADDVVRRVASGATFGFADEIAAGMNAALDNELTYEDALTIERERDRAFVESNPGTAISAEIAGGITSPAVRGVGRGVMALAEKLPRYGQYAAEGAVIGGLYGVGSGETPGERATNAAFGSTLGAATGAAIPAISEVAMRGIGQGRELANRYLDPKRAGESAVGAVNRALRRDNVTPARAARKLEQIGPDSVLADIGGNTRALGEGIAQHPGRGMALAERTLNTRQAGQGDRIFQALQAAVGKQRFHPTTKSLFAERARDATPLYERAFAKELPNDLRLKRFLQDTKVVSGIRRGLDIIRREKLARDEPFNYADYGVVFKDGKMVLEGGARNLRLWDAAKRGMDDLIESQRDKTTGVLRLNQRLRSVQELKNAMVNRLDDLTVEDGQSLYKAARDAWAGPSSMVDALNRGRNFLRSDAEVTEDMIKAMTESEREAFRIGVGQKLRDLVENTVDGANAARRIFAKPALRNKIRAAFPDSRTFNEFRRIMLAELRMSDTMQQVTRNSATARRQAVQEELNTDLPAAIAEVAAGRNRYAVASSGRGILDSLRQPPENFRAAIGDMLFSQDPNAKRQAIDAFIRQNQGAVFKDQQRQRLLERLARGSAVTATAPFGPAAQ